MCFWPHTHLLVYLLCVFKQFLAQWWPIAVEICCNNNNTNTLVTLMLFYSFVLFQNLLCLEAGLAFPQVFPNISSSICQPATSRSIADAKQSRKAQRSDESLFMCDASFCFLLPSLPAFWRKCVRLTRERSAHVIIRSCCIGSDGTFVTTISIFLLLSFCVLSAMISVGITDQIG